MVPRSPVRQPQQQAEQPQPRPTTIMRRGRFVAPISAGIANDGEDGGDGGGVLPLHQHPHYYYPQQVNPYDGNSPNYQQYQQQQYRQQQVLSPASQVRFEDEQRQHQNNHQQQQQQLLGAGEDEHSPSFLFEEGEWSESEADYDDIDIDTVANDNMSAGGASHGNGKNSPVLLPSETQLTLLCLDYLRDLRRSYPNSDDLRNAEGLDADYIALAAWSLSRAFVRPEKLRHADPKISTVTETTKTRKGGVERMIQTHYLGGGGLESDGLNDESMGNDAWYRQLDDDLDVTSGMDNQSAEKIMFAISDRIRIPSMEDITNEILLRHPNESAVGVTPDEEDDEPYYEHNDAHFSNAHRFYLLNGLASFTDNGGGDGAGGNSVAASVALQGGLTTPRGFFPRGNGGGAAVATNAFDGSPLTITAIISAGLMALRAKSRIDAEKEMVTSPLFKQFVHAASAGGFFQEKRDERERGFKSSSSSTPKAIPSTISEGVDSMNNNEETEEEKNHRSRLVYESKYRKVVNKFRQKLATKDATQLLSPQNHAMASLSPRVNSAYRIMSGNASVSSGGGGTGVEWNVLKYVMNARNVVKQQQRRRERRIERVKSERSSNNERTVNKNEHDMTTSTPPRNSSQDGHPPESTTVRQVEGTKEEKMAPSAASLKTPSKIPPSPTRADAAAAVSNLPHYQEAERLNSAGNALMQQKHFQQALDTYTSAIKLAPAGPNSHVYFSNRSAAYLSLNEHERSIRDCEYSLALKPEFAKAHSRLGLAYFASGRYREAVAAYESSLEIDPNNAWSRDHLEKAKLKLHELIGDSTERCAENVGAVTKETPTSVQPFDEIKHEAEVASSKADEDKKGTVQERFAEQISQADHHKDQGNKHMSNKEYEKALHEYNLAIQISPSGPNSHVYYSNRAAAHCYLANYDAAIADCQTSISLNPSYEKAHSRLGLSLFFRGEYEAAIEAYSKSLELDPTNRASLSYLVKSKARLAEQQVVQEEKRRVEEERERNRKRLDWMGQQRQYQQQQKQQDEQHQRQQEHVQRTPPRVTGDRETSNQDDFAGNPSSGLNPNDMNDTNNEYNKPSELASVEEGLQAFDPFSTKDD